MVGPRAVAAPELDAPDPTSPSSSPTAVPAKGPRSRGRTGLVGRLLLLLFVAGSLWYGLAKIDWPALWSAITASNPLWIVAGVVASILSHLVRAHRWRLLIPDGRRIPLLHAFSATMIGYMFNNIIPRAGELARPYALSRRAGRPLSMLIASVVVERIIDGLSLAVIVVLLTVAGQELITRMLPGYTAGGLVAAIVVPVLALVVGVIVAVKTSFGDRIVDLLARMLPARFSDRIRTALADFRAGVQLGGGRSGVVIFLLSVLIWLGYFLGIYFGFFAFGFDTAYGLGLPEALITLGITSIGVTIAPTPGAFLVYHTFCIAVLKGAFGIPDEPATAFALVTHGAPYIAVTAVGALFALFENVSMSSVLEDRDALASPSAAPPTVADARGDSPNR